MNIPFFPITTTYQTLFFIKYDNRYNKPLRTPQSVPASRRGAKARRRIRNPQTTICTGLTQRRKGAKKNPKSEIRNCWGRTRRHGPNISFLRTVYFRPLQPASASNTTKDTPISSQSPKKRRIACTVPGMSFSFPQPRRQQPPVAPFSSPVSPSAWASPPPSGFASCATATVIMPPNKTSKLFQLPCHLKKLIRWTKRLRRE